MSLLEKLGNISQVKGILIDVDGTLVNLDKEFTAVTQKAVAQLYQHGFEVGLCTGRAHPVIKNYILPHFPENSVHIMEDGGQIITTQGEIKFEQLISSDLVKKLCTTAKKIGGEYGLTINQTFYYTRTFYEFIKAKDVWDKQMDIAYEFDNWATSCVHLYNIDQDQVHKILDLLDQTDLNIIRTKANKQETGVETNAFHLTAPQTDKGTTAERWVEIKDLKLNQEVMMIGDGYNDIAVMKKAGFKVAMGNGVAQLKQVADLVIGQTDNNGLANFINQFLAEYQT